MFGTVSSFNSLRKGEGVELSQLFSTIVVFFKLIGNILFKLLRTDEHGAFVPG